MLTTQHLFEISVYRLTEDTYYLQMAASIEKTNSAFESPMDEGYLRKQYGGDWMYNEIVGFLRFYRYGANQIRCEYWETNAKRKVRKAKKQFELVSDSYCKERFSRSSSNSDLADTMKTAVKHCVDRLAINKFVLHRELFDSTVDFVDWSTLLK